LLLFTTRADKKAAGPRPAAKEEKQTMKDKIALSAVGRQSHWLDGCAHEKNRCSPGLRYPSPAQPSRSGRLLTMWATYWPKTSRLFIKLNYC